MKEQKVRRKVAKPRPWTHRVYLEYDGGLDPSIERALTEAFGRMSDGAGIMFRGGGTRDLEWFFNDARSAAEAAKAAALACKRLAFKVRTTVEPL